MRMAAEGHGVAGAGYRGGRSPCELLASTLPSLFTPLQENKALVALSCFE